MQSLGRKYVGFYNKKYNRTGTLWEGRYKASLVEDSLYLFDVMRYIETQPLREKLVTFRLPLVFLAGLLTELVYGYLLFQNWFWLRSLFFGLALALASTRAKKQVGGLKI